MLPEKSLKTLIEAVSTGQSKHIKKFCDISFGPAELNRLLSTLPLSKRFISLIKDGKYLSFETLPGQVNHVLHNFRPEISKFEIKKAIRNGYTLQLRNIQHFSSEMNQLQYELMESFKCYVNMNLYYTPQGEKGSDSHFDPYDVIIIQLHGSKKWTLGKGKARSKLVLKEGEVLFLPAGMEHEAASLSKDSIHLTIGVHELTVSGLLESLLKSSRKNLLIPHRGRIHASEIRQKAKTILKGLIALSDEELENSLVSHWHENLAKTFLDFENESPLTIDSHEGTWQFKGLERELHPKRGKAKK